MFQIGICYIQLKIRYSDYQRLVFKFLHKSYIKILKINLNNKGFENRLRERFGISTIAIEIFYRA